MMKTLIRNGRIITAQNEYVSDILIEDETIAKNFSPAAPFTCSYLVL